MGKAKDNQSRIFAAVAGIIFFAAAGIAIYFGIPFFIRWPATVSVEGGILETGGSLRKIDGVLVSPEQENLAVNAVIIENHVDARPLSGLSKASLVYEAPVEGGITRFLAIFPGDVKADEIGPVRSARPYFIDLAREFGGIFAHVGGSYAALEDLNADKKNITDLNQYYKSEYFWRDEARFAPHNVYTSAGLFSLANKNLGASVPTYDRWQFKPDMPLNLRPEKNEILVSSPALAYSVKWVYDRVHNDYVRYEGGKIQKDKNGPVVRAKNVVVLKTDIEIIDAVTRRQIRIIGEGEATVFRDGEPAVGRWKKESLISRLKFYVPSGQEFVFNAGPTWIEIVSN